MGLREKRINVDPDVCHGKVCIKGTRIVVDSRGEENTHSGKQ